MSDTWSTRTAEPTWYGAGLSGLGGLYLLAEKKSLLAGRFHAHRPAIEEAFAVTRHGEKERFAQFDHLGNRMLLWHGMMWKSRLASAVYECFQAMPASHSRRAIGVRIGAAHCQFYFSTSHKTLPRSLPTTGSRLSNFGGILSQGLRIAPPEAPVCYMFGKGVYFADMCTKVCRPQNWTPRLPTGHSRILLFAHYSPAVFCTHTRGSIQCTSAVGQLLPPGSRQPVRSAPAVRRGPWRHVRALPAHRRRLLARLQKAAAGEGEHKRYARTPSSGLALLSAAPRLRALLRSTMAIQQRPGDPHHAPPCARLPAGIGMIMPDPNSTVELDGVKVWFWCSTSWLAAQMRDIPRVWVDPGGAVCAQPVPESFAILGRFVFSMADLRQPPRF